MIGWLDDKDWSHTKTKRGEKMKKIVLIFAASLLCVLMSNNAGQSAEFFTDGHITVNDKRLDIKDSAAYWDSDHRLLIFFYPFSLTEEDVKRRESGYHVDFVVSPNRPSPDPEKWKDCPFGMLEVSFSVKKKEKKKENVALTILTLLGFVENYMTLNFSYQGKEAVDSIDSIEIGRGAGGDFVEISIKGADVLSKRKGSWELKTRTRIYAGSQ